MNWLKTFKEQGPGMARDFAKDTWDSVKEHGPGTARHILHTSATAASRYARKIEDLHRAATQNDVDAIFALVKDGVDVNAKSGNGETVLHKAAIWNKVDAICALVKVGADVNAKNGNGETALHKAAILDNVDAIFTLVRAGADKNAKDNNGNTPLDAAQAIGADCIEIKAAYRRAQEAL